MLLSQCEKKRLYQVIHQKEIEERKTVMIMLFLKNIYDIGKFPLLKKDKTMIRPASMCI